MNLLLVITFVQSFLFCSFKTQRIYFASAGDLYFGRIYYKVLTEYIFKFIKRFHTNTSIVPPLSTPFQLLNYSSFIITVRTH
jgi:hypothetical protein